VLGLNDTEIGKLHDTGLVASMVPIGG
jgi:hypothetical protein